MCFFALHPRSKKISKKDAKTGTINTPCLTFVLSTFFNSLNSPPMPELHDYKHLSDASAGVEDSFAPELTFGEKAVGVYLNLSLDSNEPAIKKIFAAIIDRLNDLRASSASPEVKRLCSIAITESQGAQMWAVKAITWKD
jgi:hypothetical protein